MTNTIVLKAWRAAALGLRVTADELREAQRFSSHAVRLPTLPGGASDTTIIEVLCSAEDQAQDTAHAITVAVRHARERIEIDAACATEIQSAIDRALGAVR